MAKRALYKHSPPVHRAPKDCVIPKVQVYEMTNSYALYDSGGIKIAEFPRNQYVDNSRVLDFAITCADVLAEKYRNRGNA